LYGILKRNSAHEKSTLPNFFESEATVREASLLLREAAGIFDYIHDHICTKFSVDIREIAEKNHFPELFPDTYQALSLYAPVDDFFFFFTSYFVDIYR
jgi:hypothetical protein